MRKAFIVLLASSTATISIAAQAQTAPTNATKDQTTNGSVASPADSAAASVNGPNAAPATSPDQEAAGDIVVTAQRRAERVQEVPIGVTVVGGDQVQRDRINNIADLSKVSASVQLNQNPGGTGGGGYIRGVGTFARSRGAEPSVGIVVDGVVQGLTNVRNLSDVARLEVLRGPQGTLFGQSVSAGVVNITTPEPTTDRIYGNASVELSKDGLAGSEYGRQIARMAVNVPLTSNIAVRLSGYGSNTRGVIENSYTGKLDSYAEWGIRGRVKADFGPLTANLIGEYSLQRNGNGGGFATAWRVLDSTGKDVTTTSRTGQEYAACGFVASIDNFKNCSNAASLQRFEIKAGSLQLDYDAGPLVLTSISAYRQLDSVTNNDIDQTLESLGSSQQQSALTTNYKQWTQELRAASDPTKPLSMTAGSYYFKSTVVNVQGPAALIGGGPGIPGLISYDYTQRGLLPIATCFPVATIAACNTYVAPAARNLNQGQTFGNESLSGFGELRLKLDRFTVFGGMRVTSAKVTQVGYSGTATSNVKFSDTNLSGRVGAQFQVTPNIMTYATFSTGYKNAQVAPIQGTQPATLVKPEKPTSYEIGIKTSLFDRRLNFNVDGFYSNIDGYQTSSCVVVNNIVQCVPINLSKVVSKGIEADLFGRLTRYWTVNATFAYVNATYPAGVLADDRTTSLGGQQLLAVPRTAATFSTDYTIPLAGRLESFISFNANYVSRVRLATITASSDYTFKPHALLGARAGVRIDKSWSAAVFVDNLTNQNDPGSVSAIPALYPGNATSPAGLPAGTPINLSAQGVLHTATSLRQVGLQLQLRF